MYLCNYCKRGQLEMCQYYMEHFLEAEDTVTDCPAFEEDPEAVEEEPVCDYQ